MPAKPTKCCSRKRPPRPPTVTKAELLEEISAIVRRVLKRRDVRRLHPRAALSTAQAMALLETLHALEKTRCPRSEHE